MRARTNKKLAKSLCSCIKQVRRTVKLRKGSVRGSVGKEQAAIGICVKSVLQTRGKTLRKFKCTGKKGPVLETQPRISEQP
jgi:hypothetical protein